MSIDKITEFKSSILDEVYRHQGFLTSVSNTIDSYDETKKQQLTQLVTEQQRRINKSLGLIYSFFRTTASFDELENQIKQLVGDDLDNSFIMNNSEDFEASFDNSGMISDTVEGVQSDVQPVEQSDSSQLFDSNIGANLSDVIQAEDVSVQPEVAVTDGIITTSVGTDEQAVVQDAVSTSDFILSPIEESVVVDDTIVQNNEVNSVVDSSSVEANQIAVVENQVAPAPVADVVPDASLQVAQDTVNVSSNTSGLGPKKFVRSSQGQVKAILVTAGQISKLSGSKEAQKTLLANGDTSQTSFSQDVDVSNEPANVQLQVQNLMNQASQAYAAGKTEEAQMYMNQASELNKTLQQSQPNQNDGGIALVKKEI